MKRLPIALALATSATILWGAAASAGPPPWSMDPGEGAPGTEITIHGTCADDVNAWEAVSFSFETEDGTHLATTSHPITAGDAWALPLAVPDAEPGTHRIAKQCHRVDDLGDFDGGEQTTRQRFDVLEPEVPDGPPVSVTEQTRPARATATPAIAVDRAPAFTG